MDKKNCLCAIYRVKYRYVYFYPNEVCMYGDNEKEELPMQEFIDKYKNNYRLHLPLDSRNCILINNSLPKNINVIKRYIMISIKEQEHQFTSFLDAMLIGHNEKLYF